MKIILKTSSFSLDSMVGPTAYQQQFAMAQYSAPPIPSWWLKLLYKRLKRVQPKCFDSFTTSTLGEKLAVKIQYHGISETIKGDLSMIKPIALSMFKLNRGTMSILCRTIPVQATLEEFIGKICKTIHETIYKLTSHKGICGNNPRKGMKESIFEEAELNSRTLVIYFDLMGGLAVSL